MNFGLRLWGGPPQNFSGRPAGSFWPRPCPTLTRNLPMNDVTLPPGLRPETPHHAAAPLTTNAGFDPSRQVHLQSAHTGALITGVDLRQPLSPAEVAGISAALRQWKVVFFHDQPLSHEQHIALARQFGAPTIGHPVFGHVAGYPEVYSIAKHRQANRFVGRSELRPWSGWHTDVTAAINPPAASLLRGDSALRWRHPMDQSGRGLPGAVGPPARLCGHLVGPPPVQRPARRPGHRGVPAPGRRGPPGQRASSGARAPRDRRARAVCEPHVPQAGGGPEPT